MPFLTLSQGSPVVLTALKRTEDRAGSAPDWLARLFNPTAAEAEVTVKCPTLDICETLTLGGFEAATYRVRDGKLVPCRMDEKL